MNFVIGLPISIDWGCKIYNSILVIVDQLTKVVHNKPIKINSNTQGLAEVIIKAMIWYYGIKADQLVNY